MQGHFDILFQIASNHWYYHDTYFAGTEPSRFTDQENWLRLECTFLKGKYKFNSPKLCTKLSRNFSGAAKFFLLVFWSRNDRSWSASGIVLERKKRLSSEKSSCCQLCHGNLMAVLCARATFVNSLFGYQWNLGQSVIPTTRIGYSGEQQWR